MFGLTVSKDGVGGSDAVCSASRRERVHATCKSQELEAAMDDFEWVTARANCSVNEVFEKLRAQVKADVDIRHNLRPHGEMYAFRFISEGPQFIALVEGNKLHHAVIFTLKDGIITVSDDDDNVLFRANVTLNDDGKCVVKINEDERELWQMRKMALEKLFFTEWYKKRQ